MRNWRSRHAAGHRSFDPRRPLQRPDAQQTPNSPGEIFLQAASSVAPPSHEGDFFAAPPARQFISQGVAARIVFNFRQILLWLLAVLCIMSFVVLGWVLIEFAKHEKDPCDVPLALYVKVWVVLWVFGVWKKDFYKCLLRWSPEEGTPPLRVRIVDLIHIGIVHTWVAVGIYWVGSSQQCSNTAPELFTAVKWWVHLQAVVLLTGCLAIVASRCLLYWLQRNSELDVGVDASVLVARTMDEVKFDLSNPQLLDEKGRAQQCSVCYEQFDSQHTMRKLRPSFVPYHSF